MISKARECYLKAKKDQLSVFLLADKTCSSFESSDYGDVHIWHFGNGSKIIGTHAGLVIEDNQGE